MRKYLRWLLPLSAVPVLLLLTYGLTRDTFVLPSAIVGTEAPVFDLETMDGDSLALESLRGKVVLLNFCASWCIPCLAEHAVLVRASQELPADRFVLLGVVYQDTPENARSFMRRLGGDWPSVLDLNSRTAMDYGVYGVPESFFVDQNGMVAFKQVGPLSWEVVKSKVDSLLADPGEQMTDAAGEFAGLDRFEALLPGRRPRVIV